MLVTVVDEVDAGIDMFVPDLSVCWDTFDRSVGLQVVNFAGLNAFAANERNGTGTFKRRMQLSTAQLDVVSGGIQEDRVAATARQEADVGRGLAVIFLKRNGGWGNAAVSLCLRVKSRIKS